MGLACILALVALPGRGHAESAGPPWLRLERATASPSVIDGYAQLRLYATAVNLQGVFIEDITGPKAWTLTLSKRKKRVPYIAGRFENTRDELAVAIIIATTPDFADVLPAIKREAAELIESLPRKRTQVAIVGYDSEVHGGRRVRSVGRALKDLDKLYATDIPGEEELLKAVDRGRRAVAKAKPEVEGAALRRLVVVISDGRDVDYPNAKSYRKVARRADRAEAPIHSIAYAPDGNRLPLRGLGELSRRSGGTFRFAYTKAGFGSHFDQLAKEVLSQYVLTFFVPADDVVGKRVGLLATAKGLESTDTVRVRKLTCGGETCADSAYCVASRCVARNRDTGRGVLGWVLLIGGVLVGLILLFVVVSLLLAGVQRRRANAALMAAAAEQAQQAQPDDAQQAEPEPHRIVAQGPHGGWVQPAQPRAASHHGHGGQAAPPSGQHRVLPTGSQAAMPASGQHRVLPTGPHARAATPPPARAAAQPSLLVLKGPMQGQRIPLHHGFTIGKAPGCHLHLATDSYASGHHAQILMDTRGTCTLVDQGSTNGTFVNGVRTREKRLSHGMLITVGSTEARFLAQ